MSNCYQCGNKYQKGSCPKCDSYGSPYVHSSDVRYHGHQHPAPQYQIQSPQPVVVHQLVHPANGKVQGDLKEPVSRLSGQARALLGEVFQAFDNSAPSPFAQVTVTYSGTDSLAALYQDAGRTMPLNQPVTTDINGFAQIYVTGGPYDVVVERTHDGEPCGVIQEFRNLGGVFETDVPLDLEDVNECIDIQNPLVRIHDQDNCNLPDSLTTPQAVVQLANFELGLPIGNFSAAANYFECRGEQFQCGVLVFGDTTGNRFRYECDNCTQTTPPDPETVTFNPDGTSECWTRLDDFSACLQPTVDLNDVSFFVGCDSQGSNVRAAIPPITCEENYISIPARGVNGDDLKIVADFEDNVLTGNANITLDETTFRAQNGIPMEIARLSVNSPCAGVRAQISMSLHIRGSFTDGFQGAIQYVAGIATNDETLMTRRRGPGSPMTTCSRTVPYCDEKIITFSSSSPTLVEGENIFYLFFQPGDVEIWDMGEIIVNQFVINAAIPVVRCC